MRISTLQQFNTGVRSILDNQESTMRTQQQISTGRRVLTPSDDPVASTRILQLQQDISLREQYQENLTGAKNRLNLEEATLSSVTENIARIRELTVNAGNGSMTAEDRAYIASEIDTRLDALVDLMNTKDASNTYIFAGFKGETQPFQERSGGGVIYEGDDGERLLDISNSTDIQTNDSGKNLFVNVDSINDTFFTQDNGAFVLADINAGEHQLRIVKQGFDELKSSFTLSEDEYLLLELFLNINQQLDVHVKSNQMTLATQSVMISHFQS